MPSWPWTFATLPAGNVAASKLDDNFNAAMFSAGSSTSGAIPTWNGTGGSQLNTGGVVIGSGTNNIPQIASNGLLPTGIGAAAAYISFDGTSAIYVSKNVASCTKLATGVYQVVFTTGPGVSTFVAVATAYGGGPGIFAYISSKTSTTVIIGTANTLSQTTQDCPFDLACFW